MIVAPSRQPVCPCGKLLDGPWPHCLSCRRKADQADAAIAAKFPPRLTPFLPFLKATKRRRRSKPPAKETT